MWPLLRHSSRSGPWCWIATVAQSICYGGQRGITAGEEHEPKTDRGERYVELCDRALIALKRQRAHTFMLGGELFVFYNPVENQPWAIDRVTGRTQRESYWEPTLIRNGWRSNSVSPSRCLIGCMAGSGSMDAISGARSPSLNARSQDGHKSGPDEIKNMNLKKFPVGGSGFEPL